MGPTPSIRDTPTEVDERTAQSLRDIRLRKQRCHVDLEVATTPEMRDEVEEHLHSLEIAEIALTRRHPAKILESPSKILPIVVRGQHLEYKPWQSSDMTAVLEKLPTLQDGAHPWISKLEEALVGTQPAVGDIKRLLATLLGVHALKDILKKAGLYRYVTTAVNDSELFAAVRGQVWGVLRETFPTNAHPNNIFIEPLGPAENPRAYVARAHQTWRHITGNDPDVAQMEKAILRDKIQKGLPLQVRSKLAEVVGLGSMSRAIYTDHIAHQVELQRQKELIQKEQNLEMMRKKSNTVSWDKKGKETSRSTTDAGPAHPEPLQSNTIPATWRTIYSTSAAAKGSCAEPSFLEGEGQWPQRKRRHSGSDGRLSTDTRPVLYLWPNGTLGSLLLAARGEPAAWWSHHTYKQSTSAASRSS
ncbi:uncharacterized protein LOC133480455 isoform X4 [Phyllopteryx taeniolatus]|uniref:uncharacterized protein LOC133480455 isoform X4 n=1 Tax=Phyllopteryx taeniolatus TaxID=161469 RepID=UPI002AD22B4A|nr:uncharacterized protein LOC133480455 isoform X4 [Phyllopteryx taeniolatus]